MSPTTVVKWIKRWEETNNLNDKARTGAPRKTTLEQDGRIVAAAEADPHTNAVAIVNDLQLDVGAMTQFMLLDRHKQMRGFAPPPLACSALAHVDGA
ncbi:hypothetical protein Pcinc_004602 [Petrolisthes cinctipes]|uniref:Uncharacterized protein n=1 Tax=Petrolisthes cinctipes TaxID=88211 RepID=A0AAE1GGS3_PETCI|nr:hypothetical protein Pcinc_004602 [Petrolisthes cinctipes]